MKTQFELKNLTFKQARARDIAKVEHWLLKERVKEYWGDGGLTLPDLKKFVQGEPSMFSHIFGFYLDKPIAFFMTSILEENHQWKLWMEPFQTHLSLDFMIGDDNFVGRGLAHLLVNKFIAVECAQASAVFTDPESRNTKAIHVYEKAGFKAQGLYKPVEGNWAGIEHLVMKKAATSSFK